MKLSIAKKLFVSHLGLTMVVLLTTLALARWSFDRGFEDYRNALEEERLGALAEELIERYREDGNSWAQLTDEQFQMLARTSRPAKKLAKNAGERAANRSDRNTDERKPRKRRKPMAPTSLYDTGGRHIAGEKLTAAARADASRVNVSVDGEIVGRLFSTPRRRFSSPPETRFREQQMLSSLVTAAAMLSLAIAVSYLLTRLLTRPLARVTHSIRQLSAGHYGGRLIDSSKGSRSGDEIQNLMLDLDRLAGTLEQNRDARRRWLADTAHELRTPLTVLVGDVAALRDGVRTFDEAQLASLERSTTRLHLLVEDLHQLAISDVGGLRYQFEQVDLRALVEQAVHSVRDSAPPPLTLEIRGPHELGLQADPHRLAQLLDNLLANSRAYTDRPGRIVVTLSREADAAKLEIDDTAPGASTDDCKKIFEPLYRHESSRDRRSAGAGLGLAICRNIVHAHHGSISAAPSELGGLNITVTLPLDLAMADTTEGAMN